MRAEGRGVVLESGSGALVVIDGENRRVQDWVK